MRLLRAVLQPRCLPLALLLAWTARATTVVVLNPSNMDSNGWAFRLQAPGPGWTGNASIVPGPGTPPAGTSSVLLDTGNDGSGGSEIRSTFYGSSANTYNGVSLNAFNTLGYSTYETTINGSMYTYMDLDIQFNNSGNVDDELIFSPQYQGVTVQTGVWQTWSATQTTGGWWSTNAGSQGFGGTPSTGGVITLAAYLAAAAAHGKTSVTITNPGFSDLSNQGIGGVKVQSGFGNTTDRYVGNIADIFVGLAGFDTLEFEFDYSPEPLTYATASAGLLALGYLRRRRRKFSRRTRP